MPPKRRDKDGETSSKQQIKEDTLQSDHSAFLQAFEKPTQIYRYLKTRNMISPIFLNRNLSYMKNRMSRSHKKRKTFQVDSMLGTKMRTEKNNAYNWINDHLTMIFLGFYDKNLEKQIDSKYSWVKVETILLKISHKKRKDSTSALVQATVGNSDVPLNPKENDTDKVPAISVPKESFKPLGGPLQLSFILLFRIQHYPSIANGTDEEPLSKRPKLTTKLYGSELIIFDKQGRCLLTEGDYELNVQEVPTQSISKYSSPKKLSTWEHLSADAKNIDFCDASLLRDDDLDGLNPFAVFDRKPMLKFRLSWTKDAFGGLVERPRAILLDVERKGDATTTICNKENLPGQLSHTINNNIYGLPHQNGLNNTKDSSANDSMLTNYSHQENNADKIQLIYQFIYNNNSRQQTEPCQDLHCPWCSLNCNCLYSLLKHLKLCHARFNFNYVPQPNGGARIDVSINEIYDGSYTGSPHDLLLGAKSFSRTGPVRRTSVTNILVCRPRRGIKPSLSEFIELDEAADYEIQRPYITGHNRLYHHTETCLPVHPKELDIDSEGESDPLWLQQKTKQMIDEFTDVNEGEKELMKLWNLHVMKYGYVGDCQIAICISMFLDCHGVELLEKNLYRNFVLHMCSLFDFGLVSPETLHKTIQKMQSMMSECPQSRKIISEGRELQREYWRTVGVFKQEQDLLKQQQQKQKEQELKSRYRKEYKESGPMELDDKAAGEASISTKTTTTVTSGVTVKTTESKRKSSLTVSTTKSEVVTAPTCGFGLKRKMSQILDRRSASSLLSATLQVHLTPIPVTSATTIIGKSETIKCISTRRSTSTKTTTSTVTSKAASSTQISKTMIKNRRKSTIQICQTSNTRKRQSM